MRGVDFFIFPHWSMVHYGKIISQRFGHCKLSVQRGPSISPKWHSLLSSEQGNERVRGVDFFIFPHWSMVHYGKIISKRFGHCKLSVQRGPSIFPEKAFVAFLQA